MQEHLQPEDLLGCLVSRSTRVRKVAYEEASNIPPDYKIRNTLIACLARESDKQVKIPLLLALGKHGAGSREAHAAMQDTAYSQDESDEVRLAAAKACSEAGGIREAIPVLMHCANSKIPYVPEHAIRAIGECGPDAAIAAEFLANIALDEQRYGDDRAEAVRAIIAIGAAKRMFASLLACLGANHAKVVFKVLAWLEKTALDASALPGLITALNYRDPETGYTKNRAPGIMFLGGLDMHATIAKKLGELGSDAESAIPVLEELLTRSLSLGEAESRWLEKRVLKPQKRGRRVQSGIAAEETERRDSIRLTSDAGKAAARDALAQIREALKPKK